jgi:hypothetical protein
MSVWIFPASQEAFEEEGHTSPADLYQNIRNMVNLANQRANTNYQTAEAVKADRHEARQLLAEVTQQLQEAQTNAPPVPEQVQELTQRLYHYTQQLTEAHNEVNNLEAQVTTVQTQLNLARHALLPVNPPAGPGRNPAPLPPQRSEKMPDPEKFHGDRTKLPDFLTQIRWKL